MGVHESIAFGTPLDIREQPDALMSQQKATGLLLLVVVFSKFPHLLVASGILLLGIIDLH